MCTAELAVAEICWGYLNLNSLSTTALARLMTLKTAKHEVNSKTYNEGNHTTKARLDRQLSFATARHFETHFQSCVQLSDCANFVFHTGAMVVYQRLWEISSGYLDSPLAKLAKLKIAEHEIEHPIVTKAIAR